MATITSAQTGNFSATTTWVGGVVPGSADIAVAATTHQVTIDTNVTVLEFQQAGSGEFIVNSTRTISGIVRGNAGLHASSQGTIDLQSGANLTLTGNVIGSQTTNSTAAIFIGAANTTLTINGNLTGGNSTERNCIYAPLTSTGTTLTINGTTTGGTGSAAYGILWLGSGTVNLNGDVTGGTTTSTHAVVLGASAGATTWNITGAVGASVNLSSGSGISMGSVTSLQTINITGNVIARAANAISVINAIANVTVTGNVTGGTSGVSVIGINIGSPNAVVTVTGDVTGGPTNNGTGINLSGASSTCNIVGNVTAGASAGHGVLSSASANGVILQGSMTDAANGTVAVSTRLFRLTATTTGLTRHANSVGFPNGTLVSRVSPALATGVPAVTDVRSGTIYGYSNELTGTCAVPAAGSVALGVPVGSTTGTASLAPSDIAALVGAQVAAAIDALPA